MAVVRGQFIAIAAYLNVDRSNKHSQLEHTIRELETLHRRTGVLATRRQLTMAHKQLRAIGMDRAQYALLLVKYKYYAEGNKAGCFLAQHLRSQAVQWRVEKFRLVDGTLTCQEELITKEFESFYATLYAAN
ncbi:hypothetical protein NDU88_004884 [Pleurodeles waltl]|uniref:Uncharacterized protein n=1 Tax=Pleurodeles waltl TaxID=8319 RepID=A0AAV7QD72_PLEWA|nr:hypothetical protein NDU88_004884 [Pleurodeles waltl]